MPPSTWRRCASPPRCASTTETRAASTLRSTTADPLRDRHAPMEHGAPAFSGTYLASAPQLQRAFGHVPEAPTAVRAFGNANAVVDNLEEELVVHERQRDRDVG